MILKKISSFFVLFFFSLSFSLQVYAIPDYWEVWFLQEIPSYVYLKENITKIKGGLTWNSHKNCQKYGDLFFHPQEGLHEHGKTPRVEWEQEKMDWKSPDVIHCDTKNFKHFDYFCGKTGNKNSLQNSSHQIWVDTSSSLRRVDPNTNKGCYRQYFMEQISSATKMKWEFHGYDIYKKQIANPSYLCNNYGGNEQEKLLDWIKKSSVKYLIIITDISELDLKFTSFIQGNHGIMKGHHPDAKIYAKDLLEMIKKIKK